MPTPEDDALDAVRPMSDVPVAPAHAIAGVALTLALKYHDITTVQDGALYQQFKLEGKNMSPLHLDHVFETAVRMEQHLVLASERLAPLIAGIVGDVVKEALDGVFGEPETPEEDAPHDAD